jgi:ferredoxin
MTNAGLAGDPFRMVDKILKKKNLNLNSGFLVWMPENFTPRYGVWPLWLQNLCLKSADKKIDRICNNIQNNKMGTREKSHYGINWLLTIQHNFYIRKIFIEKSLKAEDYFWASDNCNGCGICAKICPVENIVFNDGKPVWGDKCEVCLGCIQWCPQKAAQFQKSTLKGKRYHHPDVVLNDFIMR